MCVGKPKSVIYTPKGHDEHIRSIHICSLMAGGGGGGGGRGGSTGNCRIRPFNGNKDKKIIY